MLSGQKTAPSEPILLAEQGVFVRRARLVRYVPVQGDLPIKPAPLERTRQGMPAVAARDALQEPMPMEQAVQIVKHVMAYVRQGTIAQQGQPHRHPQQLRALQDIIARLERACFVLHPRYLSIINVHAPSDPIILARLLSSDRGRPAFLYAPSVKLVQQAPTAQGLSIQ